MFRRIVEKGRNFIADWGVAVLLGVGAMALIWTVWYFTKVPCIMAKADAGMCNPGVLASFINADILTKSGAGGLAVAALKGGYDRYMLNKMLKQEQAARQQAEAQLAKERKRVDDAYDLVNELVTEFRNEFREARRRDEEERQQNAEERRRSAEERQQSVEERRRNAEELRRNAEELRRNAEERQQSVALQQAMLDTLVRLAQQRNGGPSVANDAAAPGGS